VFEEERIGVWLLPGLFLPWTMVAGFFLFILLLATGLLLPFGFVLVAVLFFLLVYGW